MRYLIIGKANVGIEAISEELELHGHAVPHKFEDGMSSDTTIVQFDDIDSLIQYANDNKDETFHLIYIHAASDLRKMKALAHIDATADTASAKEEIEARIKEEDAQFETLEACVRGLNPDMDTSAYLPENITAFLGFETDFTPYAASAIAADIVVSDIMYQNMCHLVGKALENNCFYMVDDRILAPSATDPNHTLSKEALIDILLSNNEQLGHLMHTLVSYENVFIDNMSPLSAESTSSDTPVERSDE